MSSNTISVKLRIVGIYFGSAPGSPPDKNATGDVTVEVSPNPTVKDVMDAAVKKANNGGVSGVSRLSYNSKSTKNGKILDEVEVSYTQPPSNKQGRNYPAGTYSLRQELHGDPIRAFQYYIYSVRPERGSDDLLRMNTDNSFTPFDKQPDNTIEDGDYVVWRLVTIRTAPDFSLIHDFDQIQNVGEIINSAAQNLQATSPLGRQTMENTGDEGENTTAEEPAEEEPEEEIEAD